MKIKPEHYQELKTAISMVPKEAALQHREDLKTDSRVKDLDTRYCFDLLYASRIKIGDGVGISGLPLYEYMNDSHILTALKAIVKELEY